MQLISEQIKLVKALLTSKYQDNLKGKKTSTAAQTKFDNLNDLIVDAIQDIKGKNIVKIDLTKLDDSSTDYYIICEGESTTQVNAIANNIKQRTKEEMGMMHFHTEGVQESKWILIDYFDTIVHVFYPATRVYYDIEDLWSDGELTEYQNL